MIITDISKLRKKNKKALADEVQEIIRELEKELVESETPGIGLAANQIGINKKIAIVRIKHKDDHDENLDLVNPVMVDQWGSFIHKGEGCLSMPGKQINTNRYREVFVKDDFHPAGFIATGLAAVVVAHEIDHLENILITDRVAGRDKIGRNDLCPCQSGKKWKKCHGKK